MKPRPTINKVCEWEQCSKPFTTTQPNTKWCGKECRDNARYTTNRNPYKPKRAITGKPCERCGQDRGPNFKICKTCVKATRGHYDPLTEFAVW